jgi:hypothetical protein
VGCSRSLATRKAFVRRSSIIDVEKPAYAGFGTLAGKV